MLVISVLSVIVAVATSNEVPDFSKTQFVRSQVEGRAVPFLGLRELMHAAEPPSLEQDNKLHHRQNFTHIDVDGKKVRLEYHVERASEDRIFSLDHDPEMLRAHCPDADEMHIEFSSAPAAAAVLKKLAPGSLICGAAHHKCDGRTIYRRVVEARVSPLGPHRIDVKVRSAKVTDFFKNAKVKFSTSRFEGFHEIPAGAGAGASTPSNWPPASPAPSQRRLNVANTSDTDASAVQVGGWFSSFLSKAWNAIKSIGSTVAKVVDAVVTVAKVLVTGKYDYGPGVLYHKSWQWNCAAGTSHKANKDFPIDYEVTCDNCYATADLQIDFEMHINDWSLNELKITGTADSEFNIEADASFSYQGQRANKVRAAFIQMTPFTFWVASVPFYVNSTVPVDVGYDLAVNAEGNVGVKANAKGHVTYGIHYVNNRLNFISDHDFDHSGGLTSLSLKMSLALQIYILPTLVVQIDHIGGPNAGLKPFLEFQADYDSSSMCGSYGGFQATTNWGLQASVGAHIDIEVGGRSLLGPKTWSKSIFSIKKPLLTACLWGSNDAQDEYHTAIGNVTTMQQESSEYGSQALVAPGVPALPTIYLDSSKARAGAVSMCNTGLLPGNVWMGTATRTGTNSRCSEYGNDPIQISLQVIDADFAGNIDFQGATNYGSASQNGEFACTVTSRYSMMYYQGSSSVVIKPVNSASDTYADCTDENTAQPYGYVGSLSGDTMQLGDSLQCFTLTLGRVPKQGQNPPDCGSGPSPSPSPGGCCGGLPASKCNLPTGGSCNFGCQCQSGNCPPGGCQ